MDFIRPIVKYLCMGMLLAAPILSAAMFKWRSLVNICLFYEISFQFLITLIPSEENNYTDIYAVLIYFVIFCCWYTDRGSQILFTTCMLCI